MVADKIIARGGEGEWHRVQLEKAPHEAAYLKLDSGKSRALLGWRPLLDLDLRLGEGTGAALGISLVEAGVKILMEMATFAGAGVAEKSEEPVKRGA